MERQFHVYILASARHGTLYVGATGNLARRIWEHRQGIPGSFTLRYGVTRLVHVEPCDTIREAMARERAVKRWRRAWKIALIESANPQWEDLYDRLMP